MPFCKARSEGKRHGHVDELLRYVEGLAPVDARYRGHAVAGFLGEPHLGEDVEQTGVHRLAFGAEEMAETQIVGEASVRDHLDPVGEYVYGRRRTLQLIAVHHGD